MREYFLAKQVHKSYWSPQRVIQPQKYEKLQIEIASTSEEAKYFFAHLQSVQRASGRLLHATAAKKLVYLRITLNTKSRLFVDNSWAKHSAANKSPGVFRAFSSM